MPAPANAALIVGASRGLGLGLAREYLTRGWRVIATTRGNDGALAALAGRERLRIEHVDIADTAAVASLRQRLADERIDVLFVVAGISGPTEPPIHAVPPEEAARVYLANAYYPVSCAETLIGLMRGNGTVAFMSSLLGSIAKNEDAGWETYRASKAALNMLARNFSIRHPQHSVVSVSPGWVRTDMGGPEAPLDVATSVRGIIDGLAARKGGSRHLYLQYDGEELPW